jgi:hypothetical protein
VHNVSFKHPCVAQNPLVNVLTAMHIHCAIISKGSMVGSSLRKDKTRVADLGPVLCVKVNLAKIR